jgi:hypothetical protein
MNNTNSEMRKELLDKFWSIYETEGTFQALSWLETLKYYEEYCEDDISALSRRVADIHMR